MKQFLLKTAPDDSGTVSVTGDDFHYLVRVRRLKPGDVFSAVTPSGEKVNLRVGSVSSRRLTGSCTASTGNSAELPEQTAVTCPEPRILLFQAIPKGSKMDLIVRQAAEGAVSEVVPFYSAHSIPRDTGREAKTERWRKIIREARQQSGSLVETTVRPPDSIGGILSYWETIKSRNSSALGLLLHQDPLEQGSFHGYLGSNPELVALAVGPEGGFSAAETALFADAGFKPLVIGSTVLRTETAALCGVAAVRIILLEKSSWMPQSRQQPNG
ncbi:RsmE family RNA methyltransferase [Breznakiella homolactica]|uniref:Ribosomal RNA small subunit methyltransferase E n=1 Tax=Breznakiella homolactica TaxID=2798577 RepID=A0A7T7XNM1_9SPIR|nr:16S rRNA (uracil(1498)-N(3))-methyltransferase [Breznakiella homolactica]QQO09674.1 16S rRNA (uracil(1498)-N(3))-methyltransferase [Breznakiella homolactica]